MFDRVASIGAAFDWITPLITVIQNYRNRPSVGYNIPVESGWSAYAISDLLKKHGIKTWGLQIFEDTIMLRLRVAQAAYAQYLFGQSGIFYYGGVDVESLNCTTRKRQTSTKRPASTDDQLSQMLQSINQFADKFTSSKL